MKPHVGWVEPGTGVPTVPGLIWVQLKEDGEEFMVRIR